ncbi:putative nuclease HARBI1 [Bombina bombina]|uniref:putative nuclease HARBI1 n=1 Tax=Bombina bombina TaxID=8345 RepID=UPI00235A6329|nr:putative nuclease HARBI1 [Bombina bombina]
MEENDLDPNTSLQRCTLVPRVFLPLCGLYALTDYEIKKWFRLNRSTILDLYGLIQHELEASTRRTRSIPVIGKLLAVLHFLDTGSFQSLSSPIVGMSQPSFSRHLGVVLKAILKHLNKYICVPKNSEQWHRIKIGLYNVAEIPNVLCAIDCTHIALVPPSSVEEQYRNRKSFHSFNVQAVCDAKLQIWEVRSGFPGSCHDYHILKQSQLYTSFERGEMPHGWLLADSGYPCRPWFLTPVPNPNSDSENRFTEAHRSTRSAVERTFGVLKMCFSALDRTGGVLMYSPEKVNDIILKCCMLHNMAVRCGDVNNIEIMNVPHDDYSPPELISQNSTQTGVSNRTEIIERYFACDTIIHCF